MAAVSSRREQRGRVPKDVCVSSSQRGRSGARGAKTSPTHVPGAGGEGCGWGMAWDAEGELAPPCCRCEPGPVPPSPLQSLPAPPEASRRIQAGCRGSTGGLSSFCTSILWKSGVHPWHCAAPGPAAGMWAGSSLVPGQAERHSLM